MILRRNKSKVWKEVYKPVQGKLNDMLDILDDLGFVIGDMNNEVLCENEFALNFHNSRNKSETILNSVNSRIFYSLKDYERAFCEDFAYNNLFSLYNFNIFWELDSAMKANDAMRFLKVMTDKRDIILNRRLKAVSGNKKQDSIMGMLEVEDVEEGEDEENYQFMTVNILDSMIKRFEDHMMEVYDEVSEIINAMHENAKVEDEHVIESDEAVNV